MIYRVNSILFAQELIVVELFELSLAAVGVIDFLSDLLILLFLAKQYLFEVLTISILLHLRSRFLPLYQVVLYVYFLLKV